MENFLRKKGPNLDGDGATVGCEKLADLRKGSVSPTPTLLTAETEVSRATIRLRMGVVAHDYIEAVASSNPAHAMWLDPLRTLLLNDQHVRFPDDMRFHLGGRELRRLLDHGFVTQREAKHNWTPLDWERLKAFDESPCAGYPYVISQNRSKPTAPAKRRACSGNHAHLIEGASMLFSVAAKSQKSRAGPTPDRHDRLTTNPL